MKLITLGCSYSDISNTDDDTIQANSDVVYPRVLDYKYNIESLNLAQCGYSNDQIIRQVYHNTKKDTTYICQLTYLHRRGRYVDIADEWIDFQPAFFQNPQIKNKKVFWKVMKEYYFDATRNAEDVPRSDKFNNLTKSQIQKLKDWYGGYMGLIHNDDEEFKHLMYQIDMLQSYVEKNNSRIMFIYWPEVNTEYQLNQIKDRNFLSIKENYSMLNWSTSNSLLGWDSHMNPEGHELLADSIFEYINQWK